ncbi:MAG: acyl--CoA ligase [Spirochaetaceae bacterium]|nr:acyl--CoA ligase [Spirochaetaceae bacterium]
MQVHHLLEKASKDNPHKNAVWFKDKWYTYFELNKVADSIAYYLVEKKIRRGDRVAILHENSFYYIAAYFGILKAGGVVVGLNTETNSESLSYLLNDSDSKCVITQKKFNRFLISALKKCPNITDLVLTEGEASLYDELADINVETINVIESRKTDALEITTIDIDLSEIVYTSGSTGKPKGVMLTHLNLVSNMRSICKYLRLTEDDRIMVILPFFYIYGKSLLLTHILKGASIVIDNSFVFPNKVLETMKKTEVTGFSGVPSTFMILLNRSSLKDTVLPKLRYVTQAGGSMAPAIQKEVVQAFSPAELFIMYGATEAAPRLSFLDPKFLFSKWGSIGVSVDNVDLLICDSEGNEVPQGEIGEIAARGSNIMKGYWKDPEETSKVLRHGMYFTGDLGRMDEEGFFYVVGRTKDMIKVKGFRVGAKEIEEVILEVDGVHETAVIGVDDPILGEAILALIISKELDWSDETEIRRHLQSRLPPLKIPKYIEFRQSFPKNESGKILKAKLKEEENNKKRESKQNVRKVFS